MRGTSTNIYSFKKGPKGRHGHLEGLEVRCGRLEGTESHRSLPGEQSGRLKDRRGRLVGREAHRRQFKPFFPNSQC